MRWSALLVMLLVAACAGTGQPAQRQFAVPDRMLVYSYSGGAIEPIANTRTGLVNGSSLQSAY